MIAFLQEQTTSLPGHMLALSKTINELCLFISRRPSPKSVGEAVELAAFFSCILLNIQAKLRIISLAFRFTCQRRSNSVSAVPPSCFLKSRPTDQGD
jgi:hypothetical protein